MSLLLVSNYFRFITLALTRISTIELQTILMLGCAVLNSQLIIHHYAILLYVLDIVLQKKKNIYTYARIYVGIMYAYAHSLLSRFATL